MTAVKAPEMNVNLIGTTRAAFCDYQMQVWILHHWMTQAMTIKSFDGVVRKEYSYDCNNALGH